LDFNKLLYAYKQSSTRMFFLDYDGTLAPIKTKPEDAVPSQELLRLLSLLSADPRNYIYIISGRDRKFLQSWIGELPVGLSAEHGAFLKPIEQDNGAEWQDVIAGKQLNLTWKDAILDTFKRFCDQVPNSFIEAKEYAITLHYRNSAKEVVQPHKKTLLEETEDLQSKHSSLDVRKGKKSLEARVTGITKGFIIKEILSMYDRQEIDFVVCVGDDVTDEDMFNQLVRETELRNVFTCTVGKKAKTSSTSYLEKQTEVIDALHVLAGTTPP